jgi:hypothetical protein
MTLDEPWLGRALVLCAVSPALTLAAVPQGVSA